MLLRPHILDGPDRVLTHTLLSRPGGRTEINFRSKPMLWHVYAPPNEDFGRPSQHFRSHFRSTFQGCEYSIWATSR
jgi:hypothetical protein